ncbi:RcgA family putative transporter [Rubellimicrobium aerolatum]|uniref:RcgA family putative transporter n=1 Tax=Rubellimicrobium aerolatum TaxID=490979 RepID=A0ABW0SDM2_9RHOB
MADLACACAEVPSWRWMRRDRRLGHGMPRREAKRDETESHRALIKNGKYFVPPEGDDDFKALFKRVAAAGGGRPVDEEGFPQGPWTPHLLAEAISRIEANRAGIDLRTVQLWFQDNDKGVSADNIRWLARIFGCDDPAATSAWQAALSAGQARLMARRRGKGRPDESDARHPGEDDGPSAAAGATPAPPQAPDVQDRAAARRGVDLARRSEAVLSHGSPLDLPATVFAGAVALGFLSYVLGIHSVAYARDDGFSKQAGFLWAPNWTVLFMVVLPLFFAFAGELLVFWKSEGRPSLLGGNDRKDSDAGWRRQVAASSTTYWAVFLICLGFAGVVQWVGVRLVPLLQGGDDHAIDWGALATVRPDLISVPQAIAFTGLAYLYMSLCFYLLFAGLILLHTVAHDCWTLDKASGGRIGPQSRPEAREVALRVLRGIFRCTVCGLLVAVCMKLQSSYVTTSAENIWRWLVNDARFDLPGPGDIISRAGSRTPTHYTSLLTASATAVVFLYAFLRVGRGRGLTAVRGRMAAAVGLLVAGYLMIDAFPGFSILLGAAILVAIYGLFDPGFGAGPRGTLEG